jgi:hypothetical protein
MRPRQLSPQCGDNPFSVFGALQSKNVVPHALTDVPVERDQMISLRVDDGFSCLRKWVRSPRCGLLNWPLLQHAFSDAVRFTLESKTCRGSLIPRWRNCWNCCARNQTSKSLPGFCAEHWPGNRSASRADYAIEGISSALGWTISKLLTFPPTPGCNICGDLA